MTLTGDQLVNTYAVAHDTSVQGGGTSEQAHRSGLLAVESRVRADAASRCVHGDGNGLCPVCDGIEIAAPVAVSDEELARVYRDAYESSFQAEVQYLARPDDTSVLTSNADLAGIRAVRAALAGPVPEWVDSVTANQTILGWELSLIGYAERRYPERKGNIRFNPVSRTSETGKGPTYHDALAAAILAAEEAE